MRWIFLKGKSITRSYFLVPNVPRLKLECPHSAFKNNLIQWLACQLVRHFRTKLKTEVNLCSLYLLCVVPFFPLHEPCDGYVLSKNGTIVFKSRKNQDLGLNLSLVLFYTLQMCKDWTFSWVI